MSFSLLVARYFSPGFAHSWAKKWAARPIVLGPNGKLLALEFKGPTDLPQCKMRPGEFDIQSIFMRLREPSQRSEPEHPVLPPEQVKFWSVSIS
ncbi:hypothetical protein [Sphingobium chungbukense]|uniref:hypothetical protein n=1 Tax=Sphingobium chungbukense TaxID=56193 RepID=UPI001E427164|nr:hypothetical protein [Sphingobium chungbukense]